MKAKPRKYPSIDGLSRKIQFWEIYFLHWVIRLGGGRHLEIWECWLINSQIFVTCHVYTATVLGSEVVNYLFREHELLKDEVAEDNKGAVMGKDGNSARYLPRDSYAELRPLSRYHLMTYKARDKVN